MSCIDCHKYVRGKVVAQREPEERGAGGIPQALAELSRMPVRPKS